jgi:hypothetical protein
MALMARHGRATVPNSVVSNSVVSCSASAARLENYTFGKQYGMHLACMKRYRTGQRGR